MRADAKQSGPNGEPGICRRWDENGRIAYAPSSRTACLERQFRQFQQGLLDAGPDVGPGSVAAHLLAFEAVVLEADLRAALAATQDRYSWRGQLCLEWSRGGDWLDRRWIGRATASAIATAPQSDAVELSALAAFASAVVPRWAGLPETEVRKRLFEAAEVWAALNVPGFLAAHVLGDVRLQPLPRAALGREQTRLAIADDSLVETSVDQMECLDVVCRGRSSRDTAVVARQTTSRHSI